MIVMKKKLIFFIFFFRSSIQLYCMGGGKISSYIEIEYTLNF